MPLKVYKRSSQSTKGFSCLIKGKFEINIFPSNYHLIITPTRVVVTLSTASDTLVKLWTVTVLSLITTEMDLSARQCFKGAYVYTSACLSLDTKAHGCLQCRRGTNLFPNSRRNPIIKAGRWAQWRNLIPSVHGLIFLQMPPTKSLETRAEIFAKRSLHCKRTNHVPIFIVFYLYIPFV